MKNDNIDGYYSAMQNYSEDDFTKEILKPLFEAMGFDRVEFHGGSYERGRDLIASSPVPGPKNKEYVAYVQSKKLNKANKLAYNDLSRLIRQLKQAKSVGYRRNDGSSVKPDLVYIVVPNKITQRFLDEMQHELFEENYEEWLQIYDCVDILRDIKEKCPDILEKLQPFEEKIWNLSSKGHSDKNKELLGALCSTRDSVDLSKFYSDLSFFVGSIDSRAILSYKVESISRNLVLTNTSQWNDIKEKRNKILELIGLDIFESDIDEMENNYQLQNNKYLSEENSRNIENYDLSLKALLSTKTEYETRVSLSLGRLDNESKKLNTSEKQTVKSIIACFRSIREKFKSGELDFDSDLNKIRSFGYNGEISESIDNTLELVLDNQEKISCQNKHIEKLKLSIVDKPKYEVSIAEKKIRYEIESRVKEYENCIKVINNAERPNLAKFRDILDSIEVDLKFLELISDSESPQSSIVTFRTSKVYDDRVSISAHDVFYTGKDIAIYGGAGVGKTTTLEMFFKEYNETINRKKIIFCSLNRVVQSLNDSKSIKIKSKDTNSNDLNNFIYSIILLSYGLKVNEDNINRLKPYLIDGTVLVFDGLDEMVTEFPVVLDAMNNFKSTYKETQWIISSRDCVSYLNEIDFLGITLLPFTSEQLKNFICGWFEDSQTGLNLWNSVSSSPLHENLLTPLVATILCTLVEKGVKAPTNESQIYQERLNLLLENYDQKKKINRQEQSRDVLMECCQKLAFSMHLMGIRNMTPSDALDILKAKLEFKYAISLLEKCLKELEDPCNILIKDKISGKLSFGHFRFQEHLASVELRENRTIEFRDIIVKDWWRGTFCLYAQFFNEIETTIDVLTLNNDEISSDAYTTLYAMCDVLTSDKKKNMKSLLKHLQQDYLSFSYDEFDDDYQFHY